MTNSLYNLIKEQSQQKGRPLKIVCDWDDCLMPLWPYIIWKASQVDCPFEWFFEAYFWKGSPLSGERKKAVEDIERNTGVKVQEKLLLWQNDEDRQKILKAYEKYQELYGEKGRFEAPFSTIAEDLLKALKEKLVDELLVITSFTYYGGKLSQSELLDNNGKLNKFFKTFGKSLSANFELTEINKNEKGEYSPERWQRIEQLLPDFDIFIDDKKQLIKDTAKAFASEKDKIYVLPDYETNREVTGPNIYHVGIGISDIKEKDFVFKNIISKRKWDNKMNVPQDIGISPHDSENISLKSIIKDQAKKKAGRKLKIICDWDECIMPVRPWAVWNFSDKELSFSQLFKEFWEHTEVSEGSVGGNKDMIYSGKNEKIKVAVEKLRELKKRRREGSKEPDFYSSPERYKAPFLSIAEELLQCFKEDLISELVVISSYRKGKSPENLSKKDIFNKIFGKFPNAKISIYEVGQDKQGNNVPHRYEWIQDNHPDFDIFIDDNSSIIKSCKKNLTADKTLVLPDYYYTKTIEGDNIHHVKTTVSDLKFEDFTKAAEEYKTKIKQEKELVRQKQKQRERAYWILGSGVVVVVLLALIIVIKKRKINGRRN